MGRQSFADDYSFLSSILMYPPAVKFLRIRLISSREVPTLMAISYYVSFSGIASRPPCSTASSSGILETLP